MSRKFDWTDERIQYLIEHFPMDSACDIADYIGCSDTLVSKKAKSLGLKKSPDFHRWNYLGRYVKHGVTRNEGKESGKTA